MVHNQVRLAPMGEVIGLDYSAVLDVIRLYVDEDNIKDVFEGVLECYRIEQEVMKEKV